jgi:hypothetical protein
VPAQLRVIWGTLQAGDEAAAQEALELFIEVAEAHPRFLRRCLPEIAAAMLQARLLSSSADPACRLALIVLDSRLQRPWAMSFAGPYLLLFAWWCALRT